MATIAELQAMYNDPNTSQARKEWIANTLSERGVQMQSQAAAPQSAASQQTPGFSFPTMLGNIPGSAADYFGGLAGAALNPIDTAASAAQFGVDLGRSVLNYDRGMENPLVGGAAAVNQYGVDRYGSPESALNTLESDPVGALGDLAGVVGGLGGASRVGRVGALMEPTTMLTKGLGGLLPQRMANSLYNSAMKFSTVDPPDVRATKIRTGLNEGLMPSPKGVSKLQNRLNELRTQQKALLESADRPIHINEITKPLRELRKELRNTPSPTYVEDLAALDKYWGELTESLSEMQKRGLIAGNLTMPAPGVQKFKESVYDDINWKKANQQGERMGNIASRAIGRGAKAALEDAAPGIGDVNQQFRGLLELQPDLIRASNRVANRNAIGLPQAGMGQTGILLDMATGTPGAGTAAGVAAGTLLAPKVSASLAILVNNIKRGDYSWVNSVPAATARAAMAAAGTPEETIEEILSGVSNTQN